MSIASTDLIAFMSANKPTDDVSTSGGAIDASYRATFTQIAANDTLEMVSSAGGDTTQVVTVAGRDAAGVYQTENKTLNGTSVVSFTTTLERVLSVSMATTATGTVTIRRSSVGPTVAQIPPGEKGFYALFIKSASSTGGVTTRYEKTFWKNTHGSLTLTSSQCRLAADANSVINQGIATSVNDSGSVANRVSAPGGVSFVSLNVDQAVPGGGNLAAGSAIGVWWLLTLAANNVAIRGTFTARITGQST